MKTIFVQIASYRDKLLVPTIKNAIQNARHPERVFFGVCLQADHDQPLHPRTKKKFVHYTDALGVGWARAQAQSLYDGEDYVLQIDSHSQFTPNWDVKAINAVKKCESQALLSQFCLEFKDDYSPVTTSAYMFDTGDYPHYLHIMQGGLQNNTGAPLQHAFICAHFIFAPAQFFEQVPIDPQMGFYYEENAMTLRAWTNGWDIYCPNRNIVKHTWKRKAAWDDSIATRMQKDRTISSRRFMRLLGLGQNPLQQYGLGDDRTLEQYHQFSGVNFWEQTITDQAKRGYCLYLPS